MDNLKKAVQKELKLHSTAMQFSDFETMYKKDSITLIKQNNEIGYLGYTFVSSKFADFGDQFGIYVSCRFGNEMKGLLKITEVINNLNLSYKAGAKLPNCFFGFTSLYYLSPKFYSNGTVSFNEKDDIEQKCKEIVEKVSELYLPKVRNFLLNTNNLINDIIEYPENYGYPMAYILTVCYLNNKTDMLEEVVNKAKLKKMYDNSHSKIQEIKLNLERYFG